MTTLLQKFQVKPGMRGGTFNAPQDLSLPIPRLPSLKVTGLDYVIVFVASAAEIRRLAGPASRSLREDGLLWFAYPKLSGSIKTDISRDVGWDPVAALGYDGVRAIAIDGTWSAMRFRDPRFSRR